MGVSEYFVPPILGTILIGIAVAVVMRKQAKEEIEKRRRLAHANGLAFYEGWSVPDEWKQLLLFQMGAKPRTRHIMRGELHGFAVHVFEHSYKPAGGGRREARVGILLTMSTEDPRFLLLPKYAEPAPPATPGMRDVPLDAELDAAYHARATAEGEGALRAVCMRPATRAWLLRHGQTHLEVNGKLLCMWAKQRPSVEAYESVVERAFAFIGTLGE